MPDTTYTDITMLLDRSGSMQSIRSDVVGGFAAYVETQQADPGRCTVSLYQFDDRYDEVYVGRPIADVPALVLEPRGSTALLDAIGRTIASTRTRLAALPEAKRPGTVVFCIMTDGMENASREYTHPAIKRLIETQEQVEGWTFQYMGADQDAIEVGTSIGIAAAQSLTFDRGKAAEALRTAGRSATRLKSARMAGLDVHASRAQAAFTEAERDQAGSS